MQILTRFMTDPERKLRTELASVPPKFPTEWSSYSLPVVTSTYVDERAGSVLRFSVNFRGVRMNIQNLTTYDALHQY